MSSSASRPSSMSMIGVPAFPEGAPIAVSSSSFCGGSVAPSKPVPMKLFATWEVDRTPPNCIPRLCSLTLTRLALYKSLGPDITSIVIAVKMQSSKRTLRSNEIMLPTNGYLDTELELTFSLQYPHFLKREENQLQIMLQRRKKYKHRTILGFKTLAVGIINMSQVLQKRLDLELELFGDQKEKSGPVPLGKVFMLSLTSQPVDHEDKKNAPEVRDIYSDEDEEYTSQEEGSDSEPLLTELHHPRRIKTRVRASKTHGSSGSRPRIKQKIVALLKKFKVTDGLDQGQEHLNKKLVSGSDEIEDLFDQLEELSDSAPEVDTISIGSTPKPSLKPFFCSSRSLLHEARSAAAAAVVAANNHGSDHLSDESSKDGISDSHPETLTDPEYSDPPLVTSSPPHSGDEVKRECRRSRLFKEKPGYFKHIAVSGSGGGYVGASTSSSQKDHKFIDRINTQAIFDQTASPRKVLIEQLSRILPNDVDLLPEQVILANTCDRQGAHLAAKLTENGHHRVVCTAGPADIRATLSCLVAKIQKFCNTQTLQSPPPLVKVALIGSDTFINSVLCHYVEVFSSKPPDLQRYILFYVIPLGINTVAKYVSTHDSQYSSLFLHESWRELLEKPEPVKSDVTTIISRVNSYMANEGQMHLPIAEAMVTYKEKNSDDESSQVFIPFISSVCVGSTHSNDYSTNDTVEETSNSVPVGDRTSVDRLTPPPSPHVGSLTPSKERSDVSSEPIDLHLDYWQGTNIGGNGVGSEAQKARGGPSTSNRESDSVVKSSIKTSIRFMQVQRLGGGGESNTFSMQYWLKEKKPKNVIRLGKKKEKDDHKSHSVESITRLICLSKNQNPLKVSIDGTEWSGVKFFQLSSQWQTHIKYFPVAVFNSVNSESL